MQRDKSRGQLGEFLRARRDALRPEDFGLSPGRRRRAPGLRRETLDQDPLRAKTSFGWSRQTSGNTTLRFSILGMSFHAM